MRNYTNYILASIAMVLAISTYFNYKKTKEIEDKVDHFKSQIVAQRLLLGKTLMEISASEKNNNNQTIRTTKKEVSPYQMKQQYEIFGDKQADITLEVYTDPECVYCKKFHGKPASVAEMSSGKVNVKTVLIPLINKGEISYNEVALIECSGMYGGAYMYNQYLDQVMKTTLSNGSGSNQLKPENISGDIHKNIQKCLKAGIAADKIVVNMKKAAKHQVSMTPTTIIIDNKTKKTVKLNGSVGTQQLLEAIAAIGEKEAEEKQKSDL